MFERQPLHLVLLALLVVGVFLFLDPSVLSGEYLGVSTAVWLALAIADPIVHQIYVWLIWRLELHHGAITRRLGRERGFRLYALGFSIFFILRVVFIVLLAISNHNSLNLPPALAYGLAILLAFPTAYLGYSVARYFGVERAFGIDHFDPAYRAKPFVRGGIFRFTSNGMYLYGFLGLWIPGLVWLSKAALLAALFSHVYIWVHYYCTELPDIRRIYG